MIQRFRLIDLPTASLTLALVLTGFGATATAQSMAMNLTQGGFRVVVAQSPPGSPDALVLNRGMADVVALSGQPLLVKVPPDAFAHTNPNAVVTLSASLASGQSLPAWLQFSPTEGAFRGVSPVGVHAGLIVKVVARDNQGLQAALTFKMIVGGTSRRP